MNNKTLYPNIDHWNDLQARIDAAENYEVIKLNANCIAGTNDTALVVPEGKNVLTIDLNGYTIDRNLMHKDAVSDGNVITNNAVELYIIDSSAGKNGKIQGGNNLGNGGGIINAYDTLIIDGVTVCDNQSAGQGGGIYSTATVILKDATVTENLSEGEGGGIYMTATGEKLRISGNVKVESNTQKIKESIFTTYINSNVFLKAGTYIKVTGDLSTETCIGVSSSATSDRNITDGLKNKGSESNFESDNDEAFYVTLSSGGEARLACVYKFNFESDFDEYNYMDPIYTTEPVVVLPDCTLNPPEEEGKKFRFIGWTYDTSSVYVYPVGEELDVAPDIHEITLYPVWAEVFDITILESEHGVLTSNKSEAVKGERVRLFNTPDENYELKSVTCSYGDSQTATVYSDNYFNMPEGDVTLTAVFDYPDGIGASLYGYSISLEGDIAVNFYMELSEDVIGSENNPYMSFSVPGTSDEYASQKVYLFDQVDPDEPVARVAEVGETTYYVFKCKVAAKDMTAPITAQLIDGENSSNKYTYSVKEYADYLLDNADEDHPKYLAAKELVIAMLHYGANAQLYFGSENEAANAGIEDNGWSVIDSAAIDSTYDNTTENLPEGTVFAGASLSLKSKLTLSLYFESDTVLTFDCEGITAETASSGDYQIVRLRNIPAKRLNEGFTVTINGEYSVTYKPMNYCYTVLADTKGKYNDNLKNLVKALYRYYEESAEYFG